MIVFFNPRPKPSTARPIRDDQFLLCPGYVQLLKLQKFCTNSSCIVPLRWIGILAQYNASKYFSLSVRKSHLISNTKKIFRIIPGLSGFSCGASRLVSSLQSVSLKKALHNPSEQVCECVRPFIWGHPVKTTVCEIVNVAPNKAWSLSLVDHLLGRGRWVEWVVWR